MYEIAKPLRASRQSLTRSRTASSRICSRSSRCPKTRRTSSVPGTTFGARRRRLTSVGMDANAALKDAIASYEGFPAAASAEDVYKIVAPLADRWFSWLQTKSGFELDDDDIPF
jgi:hypothetical protein